jgi:hypothetical protein
MYSKRHARTYIRTPNVTYYEMAYCSVIKESRRDWWWDISLETCSPIKILGESSTAVYR